MAVVYAGCDAEWALCVRRNFEFVADQCGAAGLDGIVVGHGMDGPDFVIVDKLAGEIDGAVGEAVGAGVEHAVRLEETAVIDVVSGGVFDGDLDPGFVEIANFGDQRVTDVFVLDDDVGGDDAVWLKLKGNGAEGRDHVVIAGFFQSENVDVEVIAGFEELDRFLELLVEAVVVGNCGVSGEPAMRGEGAALGAVVVEDGWRATHVAALARSEVSGIKSERVALGEFGILPFVKDGEGADEFVFVERIGEIGFVAGGAEFRRAIERLHDGFGVTLGMLEDFAELNLAGNAIAVFIGHYRGHAHLIAAIARGGLQALDGMTGGAGEAVFIEGAIDMGVFGESAG